MDTRTISIGHYRIGPGQPTLLVAEIGGNHGGDVELARRMVRAASEARADAVKFQAYRSSCFMSPLSPFYEELAAEELSYDELADLMSEARSLNLASGLTAFDEAGINLALATGADFIKIASGDITHHRLLEKAARTDIPLFVSSGASSESELDAALEILAPARNRLLILQCTSLYPTPPDMADVGVMARWLRNGLAAGFSDHTLGTAAARLAIALGAWALEKHFTTDRSLPGGDNAMSALPPDFEELAGWNAMRARLWGDERKKIQPAETAVRPLIRRAVVARRDLPEGLCLMENDVALLRPPRAEGALGPETLVDLLGRALLRPVVRGELIRLSDLAPADD